LQMFFLMPVAVGQSTTKEWAHEGIPLLLLDLALAVVIGYFIARNLIRLWLAPPAEASRLTVTLQLVIGGVLLLASAGPLLESHRYSTKPMGVALLLVGAVLALLGQRDVARIRARRSVTSGR
jgi:hypothetical protein